MMKNKIFSIERFALLYKKDFIEGWKTLLLRFVMLYAILAIIFCFIGHSEVESRLNHVDVGSYNDVLYLRFVVFLFWGFGCLFASLMMERMKDKTKRISYLMTPATTFEKFFSRFLLVVVIYIIAFFLAFKLADYTRIAIFSVRYPELQIFPINMSMLCSNKGEALASSWPEFITVFTIYMYFQSLFILGSILWYKNPFIKTLAAGVVIAIVFAIVDSLLVHSLFSDISIRTSAGNYTHELAEQWLTKRNITIFFSLLTLFNCNISYFRFKDSEIINRF